MNKLMREPQPPPARWFLKDNEEKCLLTGASFEKKGFTNNPKEDTINQLSIC